jgi:hypothetical protein
MTRAGRTSSKVRGRLMRVSAEILMVIAIVLATASFAIVGALWMARKRRDADMREHGTPLLVMPPMSSGFGGDRLPRGNEVSPPRGNEVFPSRAAEASPPRRSPVFHPMSDVSEPPREVFVAQSVHAAATVSDPLTATTHRFVSGSPAPEVVHGHSLRFHRPVDGTLEFLPGYLEVIGGPDAGHELRFVRPSDGSDAVVTFGRRDGPPYTHVQLLEPTVSRSHARLGQDADRWRLVNLSRTNPVVVNRGPLDGVEASQLLADGDVIEMGALVFRFHAGR